MGKFYYGFDIADAYGGLGLCLGSRHIPQFLFREIDDVEYIDVTDFATTDPSRLLTEHSMTPVAIEARRRAAMHNDIFRMIDQIERILRKFERKSLHIPTGAGRCAYRWENELADKIFDAFFLLEEQIQSVLSDFSKASTQPSWDLREYFGCNNEEYAEAARADADELRRFELRNDFEAAVMHLINPKSNFQDDLPF